MLKLKDLKAIRDEFKKQGKEVTLAEIQAIAMEDMEIEDVAESGQKENDGAREWLLSGKEFVAKSASAEGNLLYSYNTIIAKKSGKKLYVNNEKYSNTTSKFVSSVKLDAKNLGYEVIEKPESFFNTSMPEKLPLGFNKRKAMSNEMSKEVAIDDEMVIDHNLAKSLNIDPEYVDIAEDIGVQMILVDENEAQHKRGIHRHDWDESDIQDALEVASRDMFKKIYLHMDLSSPRTEMVSDYDDEKELDLDIKWYYYLASIRYDEETGEVVHDGIGGGYFKSEKEAYEWYDSMGIPKEDIDEMELLWSGRIGEYSEEIDELKQFRGDMFDEHLESEFDEGWEDEDDYALSYSHDSESDDDDAFIAVSNEEDGHKETEIEDGIKEVTQNRTFKVYRYDKAPQEVKEKIKENFNNDPSFGQFYLDERIETLKKLADRLNMNLDYSLSVVPDRGEFIEMKVKDSYDEIEDVNEAIKEFVEDPTDCPLTGVCYDEDIKDYIKKHGANYEALEDAFRDYINAIHDEYDSLLEDEHLEDFCNANEYMFTENGELY